MKLSKIVDKVKKFLEKDNLKVSQEEKLLNIIEELENKKIKIKEMKDHKREIEKQVFGRLNKQQPNYNQCKDDATT